MFRVAIFLAMNFVQAQLNLAPCTDDSHCSIGFYCEESGQYCRQCLRCGDLQRESPQEDVCVKSLVQCGECFKGLVAEKANGNEQINAGCVLFMDEADKHHPYLPPYAWAAIAIGLVLMLLTVFVLFKTKMFKVVSYSSDTSVHSLRAREGAERVAAVPPPPYNYHLPTFPPGSTDTEMPEIRRLVDSPELSSTKPPESRPSCPRETAGSQEARVFNNPAYVRIPQSDTRCSSPEVSTPEVEAATVGQDSNSLEHNEPSRNVVKLDSDMAGRVRRYGSQESTSEKTQKNEELASGKIQDSNNNLRPESSGSGPKIVEENTSGARVFGGTSFVINVVENFNSLQQENHVNCYHTDPV